MKVLLCLVFTIGMAQNLNKFLKSITTNADCYKDDTYSIFNDSEWKICQTYNANGAVS